MLVYCIHTTHTSGLLLHGIRAVCGKDVVMQLFEKLRKFLYILWF
jgi:hypothetical protein